MLRKNEVNPSTGTWCILTVKDNMIPHVDPPPPRNAQNRSELLVIFAITTSPDAVNTFAYTKLSTPNPTLLLTGDNPPPSVKPTTPYIYNGYLILSWNDDLRLLGN